MKVLVTGSNGFIGRNIISSLPNEWNVFESDPPEKSTIPNILKKNKLKSFDIIFHLGMPSSAPKMKGGNLYHETIREFDEILNYSKKYNSKLIFASTSSLYRNSSLPNKEIEDVFPFDYYTKSRYYMEKKALGANVIALRLFSVYGYGESKKRKFANVISQMILNPRFKIYGDGEQTRDFIFVTDVVKAFLLASKSKERGIFNVGTGIQTSFNEIANIVGLKKRYCKNPINEYVEQTQADINKSLRILNFKSQVNLKEGIKLTKKHLEAICLN